MLHKTKALVLSYIPYRETSIIVKMYTEKFGLQSYVVNSVRTPKGKQKAAFFQSLTLLELVVYFKENRDLHRISEIKCSHPLQSIPYDISKTTQAIFINEILLKTLKEHSPNKELFLFLYQSVLVLDEPAFSDSIFHIKMMIKLSKYLGFAPENSMEVYEQLAEVGLHIAHENKHEKEFDLLLKAEWSDDPRISNTKRNDILNALLKFYELHIETFGTIKSLSVLREVLH